MAIGVTVPPAPKSGGDGPVAHSRRTAAWWAPVLNIFAIGLVYIDLPDGRLGTSYHGQETDQLLTVDQLLTGGGVDVARGRSPVGYLASKVVLEARAGQTTRQK